MKKVQTIKLNSKTLIFCGDLHGNLQYLKYKINEQHLKDCCIIVCGEFGFGGEVGISTNTLPPRGPVGLNQLVSYKYEIKSSGKIRR